MRRGTWCSKTLHPNRITDILTISFRGQNLAFLERSTLVYEGQSFLYTFLCALPLCNNLKRKKNSGRRQELRCSRSLHSNSVTHFLAISFLSDVNKEVSHSDQDETVKDKAFTSTLVKSLGTRTRKRTNITSFSWQNSEASDCTVAYEGQTSFYTFIMRSNNLWSQNFRLWVGPWCSKTTAPVPSGTFPSLAELSKPSTWRAVFIAHIFVHSERCPVSQ